MQVHRSVDAARLAFLGCVLHPPSPFRTVVLSWTRPLQLGRADGPKITAVRCAAYRPLMTPEQPPSCHSHLTPLE